MHSKLYTLNLRFLSFPAAQQIAIVHSLKKTDQELIKCYGEYLVSLVYFLLLLPLPLHPSLCPKRELHLGNGNKKRNKVLQFVPKTHPKTCTQNLTLFLYRDDELEDGIGL